MSLFKVCRWWNIQTPENQEKFDSFSLHCCRLALEENEKDYIIVGSHSGYLCVYQPKCEHNEDGSVSGFNPASVVLETKLLLPVIGIESGKFSTSTNVWQHLAILHPMKLCVYSIIKSNGVAEHGDQSKLQLVYEHPLKKFAFSICKGNFGGVKGREFFCVLHMDGSLRFYEQDGITFDCQLPNERNIPSPILYTSRTDSFVTVSPGWDVECFRYQDLAHSNINSNIRELSPTWSFCIGESALDLAVHQVSNTESVIVVLGEHNLYCLSDNGKSKFIKRLDYTPVCFCSFVIGWYWESDAKLMISIVSDSGSLLVYDQMNLVWAAQLTEVPVAIKRANVQDLPGAIVTLGCVGNVFVGYLGSEPQTFKVPPLDLKELIFEKAQQELNELEKEIKQSVDVTDIALINAAVERELMVQVTVSSKLETSTFDKNEETLSKMCLVEVYLKCNSNIDEIQVYFELSPPLRSSIDSLLFQNIDTDWSEKLSTWIYFEEFVDPIDLKVSVLVSYINRQSIPRVIKKTAMLPSALVWKVATPQKDAEYKITLSLEDSTKNLLTIFKEFNEESESQAFALQSLYSNGIVTLVQAKSSSRFRLQSDSISAMSLVFSIIIERLLDSTKNEASSTLINDNSKKQLNKNQFKVMNISQKLIDDILKYIDEHHETQTMEERLLKELESHCGQIRLVERRLLVKIQDRTPNALGGITTLLKITYSNINETAVKIKEVRTKLRTAQITLSSGIYLLKNIIKFLGLPPKTTEGFVESLLCPVIDTSFLSWEEMITPSLELLNYIGPLKKYKNSTIDEQPNYKIPDKIDIKRLKKQIGSLYERLLHLTKTNDQQNKVLSKVNSSSKIDYNAISTESESKIKAITTITENENNSNDEADDETKTCDWLNNNTTSNDPNENFDLSKIGLA